MKRLNKNFTNLNFKDRSELLNECEKIICESKVLNPILTEIKNLKRGKVNPIDTKKRSKIGSYFSNQALQLIYAISRKKIDGEENVINSLHSVHEKAEEVVRENIVLQSKPPLDVIKFKNILKRYVYTEDGKKEQRFCLGMHKLHFTEQDYSISFAFMPPKHTQILHNHTVPEYTFVDKETHSLYKVNNMKKTIIANKYEILYFAKTTIHTIHNPTNSISRNMTVKSPTCVLDWKPYYDLNPIKKEYAKVLKGKSSKININELKISFSIKDKHYNYYLEILELKKGSVMKGIYNKDRYFFVIDGEFLISSGNIKKYCSKNDYIVIDKNTNFKIETKTKSRLYTVINR